MHHACTDQSEAGQKPHLKYVIKLILSCEISLFWCGHFWIVLYRGSLFGLVWFGLWVWEAPLKKLISCCCTAWNRGENTLENCSRCTSLIEPSTAHCVTCRLGETWNLMNFLTLGKSMMFQNSSTSQRKCLSCTLLKQFIPPDSSIATFSASTYDISQLLSALFLLNLLLSIMSIPYEVVLNLNATCCVMSVCYWHSYSGSLNATSANRWQCPIFIHVSCHQFGPPTALSPPISSHSSSKSLLSVWNKRLWPFQIIKTSCEPVFIAHQTVQYRDHFPSHHTW